MRLILFLIFLASAVSADSFLFVQGGKPTTGPRELPSVGVRLDNKQAVLGLHGADDATKAACGWYRVIPAQVALASNQVVTGYSYAIGKNVAYETASVATVTNRTYSLQERMDDIFQDMPGTDSERCKAVIQAVASVVTNRVRGAVTVTIPAPKAEAVK
jgi:hypothetical protein